MFVGNLSFDTPQSELETLFSEVGPVIEVFLPTDRNTGRPRGFAFVELGNEEAATAAIAKFDGYELRGRHLRVNEAEARPPRQPRFAPSGGGPGYGGGHGGGGQKRSRPKGSRRNARGKKRSL